MAENRDPISLFEGLDDLGSVPEPPKKQEDVRRILVNFLCEAHVEQYSKLVNRRITPKTRELWFPKPTNELFEFGESAYYEAPLPTRRKFEVELGDGIFEIDEDPSYYELHWQNMPEFTQPDASAVRQITHYFRTPEEVRKFAELVDQNITQKTGSIWYPYRPKNDVADLYWITNEHQ